MPKRALRKGPRMDNVDCALFNQSKTCIIFRCIQTFSDFPPTATSVPRLVNNF